jgi:phosphoglycolate phosphatase
MQNPSPISAFNRTPLRSSLLDSLALRGAIVDLDGTMIDTLGDFEAALGLTLDDLYLPRVDRAFIERTIGRGSEHLIASTLLQSGGDASLYEQAWARYQHHYLAINGQHSAVYAGVREGLDRLTERGLKLACLTNKPTAFARPLLQAKGLDGYFDVVFGGDAFERKKPDPLPLIRTCEALGMLPRETLMLGDSSNDAAAARAAGCPVVLVTYGYNHGEPVQQVDVDGTVDRIDQLFAG